MVTEKSVSIRIPTTMLDKLRFVAKYSNRSINGQVLQLIRNEIASFEKEHGEITKEDLDALAKTGSVNR